ncbi:TolC family protein [Desulfococcaceae bacterium HSG9]|nr:TolC family protein [Desulfococcaceae bacterium HSG9]
MRKLFLVIVCMAALELIFHEDVVYPSDKNEVECTDESTIQKKAPKDLNLKEAIMLALRDNRNIEIAYIDRVAEKFDLKIAESKFLPDLKLIGELGYNKNNEEATESSTSAVIPMIEEKIPTGATLRFSWDHSNLHNEDDSFWSDSDDKLLFSLKQPLLKGAGIKVNEASRRIARLKERQNIQELKSDLIETITETIVAYHKLTKASEEKKIEGDAFKWANENILKFINNAKAYKKDTYNEGLIQAKADAASRCSNRVIAQMEQSKENLNLIKYLELNQKIDIQPSDEISINNNLQIDMKKPKIEDFTQIALHNRPDFLKLKMDNDIAMIDLMLAKNEQLWDLSLDATYTKNNEEENDEGEWWVGAKLIIPIYGPKDLIKKKRYLNAKTVLKKNEVSIDDLKNDIEIDLKNTILNAQSNHFLLKAAKRERKLSAEKLRLEQKKLDEQRLSDFDMWKLITFHTDFVTALKNETNAKFDYLDDLVYLDKLLGRTLDTWNIEFETERNEIEKEVEEVR